MSRQVTTPGVVPARSVARALDVLDTHDLSGIAVVEDARVVGWFSGSAVLAALRG